MTSMGVMMVGSCKAQELVKVDHHLVATVTHMVSVLELMSPQAAILRNTVRANTGSILAVQTGAGNATVSWANEVEAHCAVRFAACGTDLAASAARQLSARIADEVEAALLPLYVENAQLLARASEQRCELTEHVRLLQRICREGVWWRVSPCP